VPKGIFSALEYPVRCQEAEDSRERVRLGANRRCQLGGRSGRLVKRVGDPQLRDDVEAPREAMAASDL
jgi:hypothetical protein